MATGKKGLGRGLSALMADVQTQEPPAPGPGVTDPRPVSSEREVPIEVVRPNPNQPRKNFKQDELDELAASIREMGIIQPLVVRMVANGYEIVAGERRWRAAQIAKRHSVPIVVREYDEDEVLQIAIVENVQRAELNPVDEAMAYSTLIEKFGHSQEQVADVVGKSRSHVANLVRLLQLPTSVRDMLVDGRLSAGHARALIGLPDAAELADRVVKRGLSVREVEKLASSSKPGTPRKPKAAAEKDADTVALEGDLSAQLKMLVKIDHKPGAEGGVMTIGYDSLEQLDRLCQLLSSNAANIFD